MEFSEYIKRCYTIAYEKNAIVSSFGKPMNCYGFVYWYYMLCRGIDLGSYNASSFDNITNVSYYEVENPVNGDVLNLRTISGNYAVHIGIYMDGYVYHFTDMGLVSKSYDRMHNWIKGVYRVNVD